MQWETGLTITKLHDGILVQQGGFQYKARLWQLTDKVKEVIETAIKHGLTANWVKGHPKALFRQGSTEYGSGSHHITFARSNEDKNWVFVLGGESRPPNFKFVTFNKKYWGFIHRNGYEYRWEHSGGHNVYVRTEDLDSILSKLNNNIIEAVELAGRSNQRASVLQNAGITSEYDLELAFIEYLGKSDILQSDPLVRVRINRKIPDVLIDIKRGYFVIVELKYGRACKANLAQVQGYMHLTEIKENTKKTVAGVLIARSFSEDVIESVLRDKTTLVTLYKYGYKDEIELVKIAGDDVLYVHSCFSDPVDVSGGQTVIPRELIKDVLKQIADVYTEFLNFIEDELEKHPDADPLDSLVQQLREDGVLGWAQLYTDPQNQLKSVWLSVFPPGVIIPMVAAINSMSPDQQSAWLHRFLTESQGALRSVMEMESRDIEGIWSDAVNDPIGAQWLQSRRSFLMATLFDILAAMQTGKSIYQLVAEAQEGNTDSFLRAVQIDKTALEFIPYFAERNRRAADEGDINFLRRLHDHRIKPITVTRLRNVRLWLVFNMLDNMNLLEQFEEDIDSFERMCREMRVYGAHPDVEWFGENDFEARLNDYRRIRRQLLPRTRSNLLVKNASSSNLDS